MDNKLFTKKEILELLKVSLPTLNRIMAKGEIGYVKVRTQVRFRQVDIDNYLEQQSRRRTQVSTIAG